MAQDDRYEADKCLLSPDVNLLPTSIPSKNRGVMSEVTSIVGIVAGDLCPPRNQKQVSSDDLFTYRN